MGCHEKFCYIRTCDGQKHYYGVVIRKLLYTRLKSFLFCKSSLPQPFLFLIQASLYGFPRLFTLLLSISVFFTFYTFLVVGSVRQIKLTYVGFRAHVKIASRIVSYRSHRPLVNYKKCLRWRIDARPTALRRPHALDFAAQPAAGLGRATLHASTAHSLSQAETYYYGHQSILTGCSADTHVVHTVLH